MFTVCSGEWLFLSLYGNTRNTRSMNYTPRENDKTYSIRVRYYSVTTRLFQQNRFKYHTSQFFNLFLKLFRFIINIKILKYASCKNYNTIYTITIRFYGIKLMFFWGHAPRLYHTTKFSTYGSRSKFVSWCCSSCVSKQINESTYYHLTQSL